jgi:hypothetical protein
MSRVSGARPIPDVTGWSVPERADNDDASS